MTSSVAEGGRVEPGVPVVLGQVVKDPLVVRRVLNLDGLEEIHRTRLVIADCGVYRGVDVCPEEIITG